MITIFNVGNLVWTTKDGQKIACRDLSEEHIKNIARRKFYKSSGYISMADNMDNDYSVEEISYADVMQLELLRNSKFCK